MKKIPFYFILFFINIVICFAQSSNNAALIGTWIDEDDSSSTWIFNSDGTLNIGGENIKYGVDKNKITMFLTNGHQTHTIIWDFILYDDRTLTLFTLEENDMNGFLFRKQTLYFFNLIKLEPDTIFIN
jgi:hypothetical protein